MSSRSLDHALFAAAVAATAAAAAAELSLSRVWLPMKLLLTTVPCSRAYRVPGDNACCPCCPSQQFLLSLGTVFIVQTAVTVSLPVERLFLLILLHSRRMLHELTEDDCNLWASAVQLPAA
jgi:hypothetical protein